MKLSFYTEVITPLLIAGADQRRPDVVREGLRPPSLKGQLRFWFRTMMGDIIGDWTEGLKRIEDSVFGSTQQISSIKIRSSSLQTYRSQWAYPRMNDSGILPRTGRVVERSAIPPGALFLLTMTVNGKHALNPSLGSLYLLASLGGVGARTRRAFGSLTIRPQDTETAEAIEKAKISFDFKGSDLKEIASHFKEGLGSVKILFEHCAPSCSLYPGARYRILHSQTAMIFLIRPVEGFWRTWNNAMNSLRDDVYRGFKTSLDIGGIGSGKPRQSSPLIIQIKRRGTDDYFGILIAFNAVGTDSKYFGRGWSKLKAFLKGLTAYEVEPVSLPSV